MNNKVLFFVLIALVGLYVLTKAVKGDKTKSFEPMIVRVDTSAVTAIEITRKSEPGVVVTLNRRSDGWTVSDGSASASAPAANVAPTLGALSAIEANRIVARTADKWPDYEVGEDASRVRVMAGEKEVADLVIGAFKFDQARRSASTYVRQGGDESVYLVEGFLAMQLTQGMDSYRNNIVVKALPDNVTRIEYRTDNETEVLTRDLDGTWLYAGMEAIDSAGIAGYLNGVANLTSRDFAKGDGSFGEPMKSLRLTGNNMDPVEVALFSSPDTLNPFVVGSSLNSDAYFASDSTGLYRKVFRELDRLLDQLRSVTGKRVGHHAKCRVTRIQFLAIWVF